MKPHLLKQEQVAKLPFLSPLVCLVAGIWAQPFFALNSLQWTAIFCICFLVFLIAHVIRSGKEFYKPLRNISYWCCFIMLGATASYLNDIRNHNSWYGHNITSSKAFAIEIVGEPQQKPRTTLLPVRVKQREEKGRWKTAKGELLLYIYSGQDNRTYHKGQSFIIPNRLQAIVDRGNPYEFSYSAHCARQQLYYQAFLHGADLVAYKTIRTHTFGLDRIRSLLMQSIEHNVKDTTTRSMIEATLLNERSSLNDELWQAYSITGIVHIIAISGMHVALLFSIILFLLYWIRNKKHNWIKYILALPVVWLYIAITGYPPSAVRAAVLFSLLALGLSINRKGQPVNTWAATAFLLLAYNPAWLFDVGVQLSFVSVLSILLFYKPIRQCIQPGNIVLLQLWNTISVCIAAQILVFPLVLYYFHQFPLLGIIANIPAALYSFLLMTGSIMLFFLDALGIRCQWLGSGLSAVTTAFHYIIVQLSHYTPENMRQLYIGKKELYMLLGAIAGFSLFFFKLQVRYMYGGLTSLILLCGLLIYKDVLSLRQNKIIVYNATGSSLIDLFRGKSIRSLSQEVPKAKDHRYYLLPSRLGHRAITSGLNQTHAPLWKIAGKRILILDTLLTGTAQSFPVHYLVVHKDCKFRPKLWKSVFRPVLVIIDGSVPKKQALRWQTELEQAHLRVHWVGERGAWCYPAEDSRMTFFSVNN